MSKLYLIVFTSLFFFGVTLRVNAQEKKRTRPLGQPKADSLELKDTVKQIDLGDVYNSIAHKHRPDTAKKKDSIGTHVVKSFIPAVGYTLTSGLALTLSGNLAFRLSPTAHISTITASAAFTSKAQFTLPLESTIWDKSGEYIFLGDDRFYSYPQSTYGLGSSSNIANEDPMNYLYVRLSETVLRHVTGKLYLGGGYIVDYHSNITEMGNPNGARSDYSIYGASSTTTSSGITLNGLFDARDNPINPVMGFYAAVQYRDSYDFLGSTASWSSIIIDVRKYIRFPEGSNNVLALWSYDWLVLTGKPPYLDLPSTSWDQFSSTGRGYIQGRFRGAQMVYAEAEYRYKISANGLFNGVVFFNAESFSAAPGTNLQGIQPGIGPGVRIKLNKVSKTNVCIDYGFGREGSRGLFVNVGELF